MDKNHYASFLVPRIELRILPLINRSAVFVSVVGILVLGAFAILFSSRMGPMEWFIAASVVLGGGSVAGWFFLRRLRVWREGSSRSEAKYEVFSDGRLRDLEITGLGVSNGLREVMVVCVQSPRGGIGRRINLRVTILCNGSALTSRRLHHRVEPARLIWLNQPGQLPVIRFEIDKGKDREGSWVAWIIIRGDGDPPAELIARSIDGSK